jgi:hypothetical protein
MRRFLVLLALSLAPAHAFFQPKPPVRPTRPGVPVEIREGTFATYLQPRADSVSRADTALRTEADTKQRVHWNSLRAHLSTVPEARTDLTASTRWWRAGQVSTVSGVVLLCVGALQEDPSGPVIATSLFGGLGLMALGAGFGVLSDRRMIEAVKKYNATLPPSVGLDLNWTPERSNVALRFRF